MRTAADYFGLMAYLFVMHGGVPDDTPVMLEEYRKIRAAHPRRPPIRKRGRFRVLEGGRVREPNKPVRVSHSADADEAAA